MKIKNYKWGTGQRKTVQYVFQLSIKREPYPRAGFVRYDRLVWLAGRKPNRNAVGTIRAMGARHFFRGCYLGAEND